MASKLTLSEDEIDDLLYFARTNSLDDLKDFTNELATTHNVSAYKILREAQDPTSKNTILHYAAANGHVAVLDFVHSTLGTTSAPNGNEAGILGNISSGQGRLADQTNDAGNTALHWAALNGHLPCVECLVKKFQVDVTVLNGAGHDAVYEAEVNGEDDVMQWLLKEGGSVLEQALGIGNTGEGSSEGQDTDEDIDIRMSLGDTSETGNTTTTSDTVERLSAKLENTTLPQQDPAPSKGNE